MLEILFTICILWVFGKLFFLGLKAAWGLTKLLLVVLFLPVLLIGLVFGGLISIAFPIVIVIGIISSIASRT